MKSLILVIFLFLYIFNIAFIFLPEFLSTRTVIGLLAVPYFAFSKAILNKSFIKLIILLLAILIPSYITMLVNNSYEIRFFGYVFQNILWLFGAFFIVSFYKLTLVEITKFVVLTILVHDIVAVLMFLIPSLSTAINGIQHLGEDDIILKITEFKSRLIGIGWGNFFFGGVISSVGLLLNSFLLLTQRNKVVYIISYFILLLTGFYIARITYVGFFLSILYMLYITYRTNIFAFFKIVRVLFACIIVVGFLLTLFLKDLLQISSFRHSFEIFINLFESGSLQSSSTDAVKEMFRFPETIRGVLFGDGMFTMPNGSYYMQTDVGYSRLAYYFGLPSILIYFANAFFIIKFSKGAYDDLRWHSLLTMLFLLLIIANFKGLVDLNWIFFLFFCSIIFSHKKCGFYKL